MSHPSRRFFTHYPHTLSREMDQCYTESVGNYAEKDFFALSDEVSTTISLENPV